MIYDCFTFYNELDVLEMRLTLLEELVDRFVLCEAPFTFSGRPKPLWYAENAARFARWQAKIVHLVYPGEPHPNPWANEWGQRAYLTSALAAGQPDDLVLIGDVDEIPHPKNVACTPPPGGILGHRQRYAVGYFNRVIQERGWVGTRAIRLGDIARFGSLADVRRGAGEDLESVDGGWHFSSLGGAEIFQTKIHSYSHKELDVPYYTDRGRLEAEFSSPAAGYLRPLEDDAPALFREARWAKYLWRGPAAIDVATAEERQHANGCFAYVPETAEAVAAYTPEHETWSAIGVERFAAAFAGAFPHLAELTAALAPGGWVVVDGLERMSAADWAVLAERRHPMVAYLRNSRSHAAIERVMQGEAFPPGRTIGVPEARAQLAAAGFVEQRCDRVTTRRIFAPPDLFPVEGTFDWFIAPFHLLGTTREAMLAFLAHAFVFVAVPA